MTQSVEIFSPDAERFPELRHLLNAYRSVPGPVQEIFTDSEDGPSRGLRSYLRVAVYYPGRAFRAVREIAEVVQYGLDHWDIARCLAHMSPVIPPKGRTRTACLLAMIPYLAEFENEGVREDPAVPDTPWEWREHFPNLAQLANEDLGGSEPVRLAAARRELDELRTLGPTPVQWSAGVAALGVRVDRLNGADPSDWFGERDGIVAAHLENIDDQSPTGLNPAYAAHDVRALW